MSLYHSFAHTSHPGFIRSIDPRSARHQLHVSLAVVVALALAIAGSALVIRPAEGFNLHGQRASLAHPATANHHRVDAAALAAVDRS
jgi:hypothetical protein